jgi:VIT1/CCC1 family predicted Fe2+/Mn2+ transporter
MKAVAGWLHRHLDPSESLLELLFGLIMAFTMTAGARLLSAPDEIDARELMVGLFGCNLAWGIIDGAFYLLGTLFERNRRVRLVRQLQAIAEESAAFSLIEAEFDLADEPEMPIEDKASFHRMVLRMLLKAGTRRAGLRRSDVVASGLIAILVTAAAVPGIVALLLIPEAYMALRVANFAQIALLFLMGYGWAHYSGTNPWHAGLVIRLIGLVLILVAVALGG